MREVRIGAGLNQEQLADLLGVTQATVSLWESGKRSPRGLYAKVVRDFIERKSPQQS